MDRSPTQQAMRNAESALRALALVPRADAGGLVPHPLDVVAAELRNALAFLRLAVDGSPAE